MTDHHYDIDYNVYEMDQNLTADQVIEIIKTRKSEIKNIWKIFNGDIQLYGLYHVFWMHSSKCADGEELWDLETTIKKTNEQYDFTNIIPYTSSDREIFRLMEQED